MRQIEAFQPLHPGGRSLRGTAIHGVMLTNADLDHTLGLLLLREGTSLSIYASRQTQSALTSGLRLLPVIRSFCQTKLFTASFTASSLDYAEGSPSGLVYQAFRGAARSLITVCQIVSPGAPSRRGHWL